MTKTIPLINFLDDSIKQIPRFGEADYVIIYQKGTFLYLREDGLYLQTHEMELVNPDQDYTKPCKICRDQMNYEEYRSVLKLVLGKYGKCSDCNQRLFEYKCLNCD